MRSVRENARRGSETDDEGVLERIVADGILSLPTAQYRYQRHIIVTERLQLVRTGAPPRRARTRSGGVLFPTRPPCPGAVGLN